MTVDPRLVSLAIAELPSIILFIKDLFQKRDPSLAPMTDAEAVAVLNSALASSLAKDADYLAHHPPGH